MGIVYVQQEALEALKEPPEGFDHAFVRSLLLTLRMIWQEDGMFVRRRVEVLSEPVGVMLNPAPRDIVGYIARVLPRSEYAARILDEENTSFLNAIDPVGSMTVEDMNYFMNLVGAFLHHEESERRLGEVRRRYGRSE